MAKVFVEEYKLESTLFYMASKDHDELDELAELIGCDNLHTGKTYHCYMVDKDQRAAAVDFGAIELSSGKMQGKIAL